MRFIQGFIILCLCVLLGTCFSDDGTLEIDIGDYESQLAAWNSQNMLDYQITVDYFRYIGEPIEAVITVKNGIPENSDPPSWLKDGRLSTIPEFYSYIKKEEEQKRKEPKKEYIRSSLNVSYNIEYHYPNSISSDVSHGSADGAWSRHEFIISLEPQGE